MPFTVSSVLASELEAVNRFHFSIDMNGPLERFVFPNGPSDITVATFTEQDKKNMHDPKSVSRPVVVKDSKTGELVSYALWMFFTEDKKANEERGWLGGEWPSDVNKEPLDVLVAEGNQWREDLMKGKPYAYLASLCTSPTHRRQGAASLLIEWGIQLADVHHLPIALEAPPTGESLYRKYGFEPIANRTIDLNPWGVSHTESLSLMVRPVAGPPPSPSTIAISPWLTNADFLSLPSIEDQAFHASMLNTLMFGPSSPDPLPTAPPDHAERAVSLLTFNASDPSSHIIKAFRPLTGDILAYGHWHFYPSSDPHPHPPIEYPPLSGNPLLGAHFFGTLARTQERHMRDQGAYAYMRMLVVRPAYHRRGIGEGILRWGLKIADEEGWKAWIDASPVGVGLYERLGWREVERLVVDGGEWGGRRGEVEATVSMLRMPGGGIRAGNQH